MYFEVAVVKGWVFEPLGWINGFDSGCASIIVDGEGVREFGKEGLEEGSVGRPDFTSIGC